MLNVVYYIEGKIHWKCSETECSEKHLHLRRIKQMSSLGHYITKNFVNYSGDLVLQCY
jgi:hypothetical protein